MANSSRRYLDSNGNQFMPMNAEGGSWNENFIDTKKLIVMGIILISLVVCIMHLGESEASFGHSVIVLGIWFIVSLYALRFIVFEEKFYYRMYKVLKDNEITTPAIFWNIASIRDTSDGAILTYSDTKIGILVKLERDTITGKHPEFKETHYDAISDFYRELMRYKYRFVQFNIMEKAGNDPRLENLDPLVHKSSNKNIRELMEKEVGYIKSISYNTLYESDYILIYTSELTKIDNIIGDSIDCIYKILDGAYIGYRILTSREIIELIKELYGIKYFNYTQATLDRQKLNGIQITKPFDIVGLEMDDGEIIELEKDQINKITRLTSDVLNGAESIDKISIRNTLKIKKNNNNFYGVDIDKIAQGHIGNSQDNQQKPKVPPVNRHMQGKQNQSRQMQNRQIQNRQAQNKQEQHKQAQNKQAQNKPVNQIELFTDDDEFIQETNNYPNIAEDIEGGEFINM